MSAGGLEWVASGWYISPNIIINSLTYAHHKRIFHLFAAHEWGMHMRDMPAPASARQCRRESARKGWPCNASR